MNDARLNTIYGFVQKMSDIKIARHPLVKEIIVILNDKDVDLYRDVETHEYLRVRKQAIFQKSTAMQYVDFDYEDTPQDLSEDTTEIIPWTVVLTKTNLDRPVTSEDQFIIDNILYTISKVKPINRNTDCVLECKVYNERDTFTPLSTVIPIQMKVVSELAMPELWLSYKFNGEKATTKVLTGLATRARVEGKNKQLTVGLFVRVANVMTPSTTWRIKDTLLNTVNGVHDPNQWINNAGVITLVLDPVSDITDVLINVEKYA